MKKLSRIIIVAVLLMAPTVYAGDFWDKKDWTPPTSKPSYPAGGFPVTKVQPYKPQPVTPVNPAPAYYVQPVPVPVPCYPPPSPCYVVPVAPLYPASTYNPYCR